MDAEKVLKLLELRDKALVPPPDNEEDTARYQEILVRNQAIVAKAEADIDVEIAT